MLSMRYISSELEEIEREDNFRLKRFKELKIKKNAEKNKQIKPIIQEPCDVCRRDTTQSDISNDISNISTISCVCSEAESKNASVCSSFKTEKSSKSNVTIDSSYNLSSECQSVKQTCSKTSYQSTVHDKSSREKRKSPKISPVPSKGSYGSIKRDSLKQKSCTCSELSSKTQSLQKSTKSDSKQTSCTCSSKTHSAQRPEKSISLKQVSCTCSDPPSKTYSLPKPKSKVEAIPIGSHASVSSKCSCSSKSSSKTSNKIPESPKVTPVPSKVSFDSGKSISVREMSCSCSELINKTSFVQKPQSKIEVKQLGSRASILSKSPCREVKKSDSSSSCTIGKHPSKTKTYKTTPISEYSPCRPSGTNFEAENLEKISNQIDEIKNLLIEFKFHSTPIQDVEKKLCACDEAKQKMYSIQYDDMKSSAMEIPFIHYDNLPKNIDNDTSLQPVSQNIHIESNAVGQFVTKFKEKVKVTRFPTEDGIICEEKQTITVKTERNIPRSSYSNNKIGISSSNFKREDLRTRSSQIKTRKTRSEDLSRKVSYKPVSASVSKSNITKQQSLTKRPRRLPCASPSLSKKASIDSRSNMKTTSSFRSTKEKEKIKFVNPSTSSKEDATPGKCIVKLVAKPDSSEQIDKDEIEVTPSTLAMLKKLFLSTGISQSLYNLFGKDKDQKENEETIGIESGPKLKPNDKPLRRYSDYDLDFEKAKDEARKQIRRWKSQNGLIRPKCSCNARKTISISGCFCKPKPRETSASCSCAKDNKIDSLSYANESIKGKKDATIVTDNINACKDISDKHTDNLAKCDCSTSRNEGNREKSTPRRNLSKNPSQETFVSCTDSIRSIANQTKPSKTSLCNIPTSILKGSRKSCGCLANNESNIRKPSTSVRHECLKQDACTSTRRSDRYDVRPLKMMVKSVENVTCPCLSDSEVVKKRKSSLKKPVARSRSMPEGDYAYSRYRQ